MKGKHTHVVHGPNTDSHGYSPAKRPSEPHSAAGGGYTSGQVKRRISCEYRDNDGEGDKTIVVRANQSLIWSGHDFSPRDACQSLVVFLHQMQWLRTSTAVVNYVLQVQKKHIPKPITKFMHLYCVYNQGRGDRRKVQFREGTCVPATYYSSQTSTMEEFLVLACLVSKQEPVCGWNGACCFESQRSRPTKDLVRFVTFAIASERRSTQKQSI